MFFCVCIMNPPRFDFTFSYWILAWFFLYLIFNVFLGHSWIVSPFLPLLIALFENLLLFLFMVLYRVRWFDLLVFCFINFFIKLLPIVYLLHIYDYEFSVGFQQAPTQIAWFVVLFLLYYLWLQFNGQTLYSKFHKFHRSLLNRTVVADFPGLYYLHR